MERFKISFRGYCLLREMAAKQSMAHLLDLAHSDRLMVVISSFRKGRDQPPPRSIRNLEQDIRRQVGYEVVHNPSCEQDPSAPAEVEGPNPVAQMPHTGTLGFTRAAGGWKEVDKDAQYEVCEDSLVVSHRRGGWHPADEDVIDFFTGLAKKYNQEAFLFKSPDSDEVLCYYTSGGPPDNLGAFTGVGTLSPYFTRLHKGSNYNNRRVAAAPKPTQADPLSDPYRRLAAVAAERGNHA